MKLFRRLIYLLAVVMLTTLANSCQDDDFYTLESEENCLKITASFANNSRAIFNEASDEHIDITNYCFVYFNDIKTTAEIITIQDLGADLSTPKYIYLPNSSDYEHENRPYYAILLANVTRQQLIDQGLIIKELITVEDLWGIITEVTKNGNNPTDPQSFTWSGYLPVMRADKNLAFTLNPNVAKITATITNNSSESDIISVQIKDVVSSVRVAQNALSKANLTNSVNNVRLDRIKTPIDDGNGGTTTQITFESVGYLDYELEELKLAKGQSRTISWYVPHNQCGTGSRPGNIPANQRPTYIEIVSKRKSDGMQVAYKLYPGTTNGATSYDDIDNFDIIADNQYTLNISVSDDGVKYVGTTTNGVFVGNQGNSTDVYVKKVVLPPHNNCYMIHPKYSDAINPAAVGTSNNTTVYELPIYERINEFWGSTDGDANNVIGDNTEWVADVIWQDINARAIHFTDETGSADQDVFNGKGKKPVYFKLNRTTLSSGMNIYGNILVGVKKKGASVYLWSWHLWVTDYNPDIAPVPSQVTSNTANYSGYNYLYVQNKSTTGPGIMDLQGAFLATTISATSYTENVFDGNVQHYSQTAAAQWSNASKAVWDGTGIYANKWIMDRNLGAQSTSCADVKNPLDGWGLYYQFGRKDPFSYKDTYTINGSTKHSAKWGVASIGSSNTVGTIKEGILHPNLFYPIKDSSGAKWAEGATSNAWFNPNWYTAGNSKGAKTLFDPCPPGWCIPSIDAFDFASLSTEANNMLSIYINSYSAITTINDPKRNFAFLVNKSSDATLYTTFPLQGIIKGETGTIHNVATSGNSLTATGGIETIRGCVWGREYIDSDGASGKLVQIQPGGTKSSVTDRRGRAYAKYELGWYIKSWITARGQNVRCIQIPD